MHIAKISAFLKLNSNKKNSFKRTVTMTRVCVAVSLSRKQFWSHFRLPNANEHVPVKWNAKRGSTSHGSRFPRDFLGIMLRSSLHVAFHFSLSRLTLFLFSLVLFSHALQMFNFITFYICTVINFVSDFCICFVCVYASQCVTQTCWICALFLLALQHTCLVFSVGSAQFSSH